MTSRFNHQTGFRSENEKFSNFQKFHLNKVIPVKVAKQSNKSMTPEKMKSEKANNSSLYDVSLKAGSVIDKKGGSKAYG